MLRSEAVSMFTTRMQELLRPHANEQPADKYCRLLHALSD